MATARIPAEIVAEDKFTPELKKIQREIAKTNEQLGAFGGVLKGIGQGVSLGLIVSAFRSVVDGLDEIGKRAQSLGFTVEGLQEIQYAASFAGVRTAEFDQAMTRLNQRMDAAARGSKEAARTFSDMGINLQAAGGGIISTDKALGDIADKFQSYRDGAEKTAIAVELFGRVAGPRLIPFLNQGREGIEKLKEEARRLGIVLGEDAVKAASDFNDELTRLGTTFRSFTAEALTPFIKALNNLVGEYEAATIAGQNFQERFGFTFKYFNLSAEEANAAVAKVNKEIKERQRILDAGTYFLINKDKVREEIAMLEREKKALDLIYQRRAPPAFEANFDQTFGKVTPPRSGKEPKPPKPKKETIDAEARAYDNYIDKLNEIIADTKEMSLAEQTLEKIRSGAFGKLKPEQEEMLVLLASQAQQIQNNAIAEKTAAEEQHRAFAQQKADYEALRQLTGDADEERIDRLSRLIEKEVELGNLSAENAQKATRTLLGVKDGAEQTTDAMEQLGLVFVSSLGEVISGTSDSNFFEALLQDITKVIVQMYILNPLIEEMQRLLKTSSSGGQANNIISILGLIFGGASGGSQNLAGVFASGGFLQPGRFGIAGESGPEVIYGGRSGMTVWPNGSSGGGGSVVINQSIQIDSRSDRASIAQAMAIAKDQAKAEIMQSMNTNGAFSRR